MKSSHQQKKHLRDVPMTVCRPASQLARHTVALVWRPTKTRAIGGRWQNLLDNQYSEFWSIQSPLRTEVPRSVPGKITWRF